MSNDPVARATAIGSLVVSICTGLVGYFNYGQQQLTFQEQKRQYELSQSEQVTVTLNPHADGSFRLTNFDFGQMGRGVQFPWRLQLSNTGNQKLSIVGYEISSGTSPNSTNYSGIDGGMITPEHSAANLPMTLDTGDSRSFSIMIGVRVPPAVFQALSAIDDPSNRTTRQATIALGRKGLDLYGNKVEFQEFEGGAYSLSVSPEDQKSPRFWYAAATGRGNKFTSSASTYDRPQ